MRLSKIGKVVKEARQCVLCNTRERTGQEANLIQQWIGSGEAMYPVDENVRLTEQGAAALMEMEGKDAEAVVWRSVGDGSELAEALKGIPARIDGAALAWKVCLKVEIQSGTVRVTELEDIAQANIDKLKKRYPDGFSSEKSLNRDNADTDSMNPVERRIFRTFCKR